MANDEVLSHQNNEKMQITLIMIQLKQSTHGFDFFIMIGVFFGQILSFIIFQYYASWTHQIEEYFLIHLQNASSLEDWIAPQEESIKSTSTCQLTKEEFIPLQGKDIVWYTCGPTVYSNSHMGHARNYICNDVIRRVLRDHFGYNVKLGMNITDVEDKIINKAKEQGINFLELTQFWENDFFEDMKVLDVEKPDYLSRVSEYIPEIIAFIQKIIENGYAYESKGDVYFSIESYRKKFQYGKLKRVKSAETEAEEKDEQNIKRNKEDFALWKSAKEGEPSWESQWGPGRPGWHIECSAMATEILGKKLDIHSGGIDLIFPHHENELAQSEAFHNDDNWVKYFIHVGHLHIKDLKMSKSLKNFITIKELVKEVNPRVIRLFFAMHKWDTLLNYDPDNSLQESTAKDLRYKNFIGTLSSSMRTNDIKKPQKLDQVDQEFDRNLESLKIKIHEEFCNNIHTPGVLEALDEGINKANVYLASPTPKYTLINKALDIFTSNFAKIGLFYSNNENNSAELENIVNATVQFRNNVRQNAKSEFKKILDICDSFRDQEAVNLGIRISDKKITDPSEWRFESKEILIQEREAKIADQKKKEEEKRKAEEEKIKKMSVNPVDLWKSDPTYTKFDENGVPTHKKQKEKEVEVDKKSREVLIKKWNAQKVDYDKYLEIYGEKQVERKKEENESPEPKTE